MMSRYHINSYTFLFIFIAFLLVEYAFSARIEAQSFVYSSQYDRMHPITEPQGMYNNIKVAKTGKLVFIAAGDSGIKVVDPDKNYDIIYIFSSDEYVEGFAITKDANYVFMPYQNKLTIYDFTSRTQFVQIGQDSVEVENVDMLINDNETIVFILQANGQIRAVNVSDKKNPKLAGTASWYPTQIYGGLLSTDNKWLLICQDFQGLGIYQITYNGDGTVTFFLAGAFLGAESSSQGVDITTNMNYVVNIDNRKGVSIGDFTQITGAGGVYKSATYLTKEWWPTDITLPAPYSLCISDDDKFLFMGVLAQGVFIVDITDKTAPILYQTIIIPYHGLSIKLSYNESDLYYVNAESFYVFPQIPPNLNEQYINLFNNHLSAGFDESSTYYYWRCYIDDTNNLYYGAFDDDGMWIIDVTDPQYMTTKIKQFRPAGSTGDIDSLIFKNGFQYVIVPTVDGTNVIAVYDTSDILAKPPNGVGAVPKQLLAHATTNYIVDFDFNQNEEILVGALGDSVIFIDSKTIGSFTVLTTWDFEPGMKGDCTGVMITMGDDYLIGASRGYGYFILDIQDLTKIKMIKYIDSLGAENMTASDLSPDYCFFIDGLRGVMIMDLTKLPEISMISQIEVPGWSNDLTFLNNEKLMLISTLEKSMLTMADISDIKNPYLVTEYLYETQNGMSSCAFSDNSYIFVNNNIGVRAVPTEGDVVMHVEVQQILGFSDELDAFQYKKMDIENIFKVGMTIQVDIVFLYQPLDLIVNKLMFYQTQTMFDLPSWITFDPDELSIKINVVKEAIDPTNMEEPLLNVIIIQTINPLYKDDFNYNTAGCVTNPTQNQAIYDYVLDNGILDDQNIVDPQLEYPDEQEIIVFPDTTLAEKAYNLCISKLIKFTLLNSIQYTPIYLYMQSSLIVDLNPADQNTYIQTVSKFITVNLLIPKFSGKFIYESQIGVDISINEEKNDIDIYGSVENVNDFLTNKIILFPLQNFFFNSIKATITVSDNVNYDYQKSVFVNKVQFIAEKKNISVNQKQILQDQLSDDYSNGEIEILTDFVFYFDESTFESPDVGQVKYSAFIKDGSDFVPLDSSYWLTFNPEGYKFFGNPPQSLFNTVTTIKLVGDDGYTKCFDTFDIKIYKLPIMFVIQWIAQILGPIIGALGFYKYRNIFYNALFKRKNRYSKICAKVNEKFVLKIPLISTELKQALDMIEEFIAYAIKESGGKGDKTNLKKLTKLNSIKIDQVENEDAMIKEEEKQEKIAMRQQEDIELAVQKLDDKDSQQSLNKDKEKAEVTQTQTHHHNPHTQHNWNTDSNDYANQFKDKIAKAKPYVRKSIIEKKYLTSEGKLDMKSITNDMLKSNISFNVLGKKLEAQAYKEELSNNKCTLYKCIKLLFSRYLISLDKKSFLVSEYIRYYGKKNCFLHTPNDWYKQFVNIISDDELDKYGHVIAFPKVELILENINTVLLSLDLLSSRMESLNSLQSKGINPHLIKQVLIADSLGINFDPPSSIFPSLGESIHLKSHELRSVESFKYSPGGAFFSIKKCFNMEYDPYGPKENMQFPNWLQLIMQSGVITLQGIPQMQDMEEVLIRFYGHQGYIYRSFTLRVQDSQGNSSRSQVVSSKTKKKNKPSVDEKVNLLNNDDSPALKPKLGVEDSTEQMDSVIDMENKGFQQQIRPSLFSGRPSAQTAFTQQQQQSPQVPILQSNNSNQNEFFKDLNL